MTIFTILGVLVYWWTMAVIGYYIGVCIDIKRGLAQWTEPSETEIEVLMRLVVSPLLYKTEPSNG